MSALGKCFEYMVKNRLEKTLERVGQLSQRQFRFRKRRSGYVALVTFDVSNAFNTAPWNIIEERVRRWIGDGGLMNIIRSYLQGIEKDWTWNS